jgi:hypothetical protein
VNWSYILKYLLATTSKLRSQLAEEQQRYASALQNNSPGKRFITPGVKRDSRGSDMLQVGNRSGEEDDEEFLVPPRAPVQSGISSTGTGSSKARLNPPSSSSSSHEGLNYPLSHDSDKLDKRSSEQDYHLRNIAAANSNMTSGNGIREERKRLSQAGKLGPRLQTSRPAVSHNAATYSEIDQIGPPPSRYDENISTPYRPHHTPHNQHISGDFSDDENFSLNDSEAAGSFRSAATVNSIPSYAAYQRKTSKPSMSQRDRDRDRGMEDSHQHYRPPQSVPSSSNFAQNVVQGLGVVGQEAEAAMTVIERVSQMTNHDLARLDAETRQQVMQIRLELGIIDADEKSPRPPPPPPPSYGDRNEYYRSTLPAGLYTPSSNITMSDDDDGFSQLDDDDENWR